MSGPEPSWPRPVDIVGPDNGSINYPMVWNIAATAIAQCKRAYLDSVPDSPVRKFEMIEL